jgi:hypothetical protein
MALYYKEISIVNTLYMPVGPDRTLIEEDRLEEQRRADWRELRRRDQERERALSRSFRIPSRYL